MVRVPVRVIPQLVMDLGDEVGTRLEPQREVELDIVRRRLTHETDAATRLSGEHEVVPTQGKRPVALNGPTGDGQRLRVALRRLDVKRAHRRRAIGHSDETMPYLESSVDAPARLARSEEHTSELQSQFHLVCRLLLEKKNTIHNNILTIEKKNKTT